MTRNTASDLNALLKTRMRHKGADYPREVHIHRKISKKSKVP